MDSFPGDSHCSSTVAAFLGSSSASVKTSVVQIFCRTNAKGPVWIFAKVIKQLMKYTTLSFKKREWLAKGLNNLYLLTRNTYPCTFARTFETIPLMQCMGQKKKKKSESKRFTHSVSKSGYSPTPILFSSSLYVICPGQLESMLIPALVFLHPWYQPAL